MSKISETYHIVEIKEGVYINHMSFQSYLTKDIKSAKVWSIDDSIVFTVATENFGTVKKLVKTWEVK